MSNAPLKSRDNPISKADRCILTLNSGSSSLKFSLFSLLNASSLSQTQEFELKLEASGNLSGIKSEGRGRFVIKDGTGKAIRDDKVDFPDHHDATRQLLDWLDRSIDQSHIAMVGHRIVHGGIKYTEPHVIDSAVIDDLRNLARFAPLHLPPAIDTLSAAMHFLGDARHVGCFDTSFHRNMPMVAKVLPVGSRLADEGVEKFGFHGLSYEYVVSELSRQAPQLAGGKLVVAHLGNGCSMAAVHAGIGMDTTMAFSPAGGLVMGTRSGDIDAGLITYFCNEKGYDANEFVNLVNQRSGLLGISELSSDMQALLEEEAKNERAKLAVDIFCYTARKFIGALASAIGGVDALVFTGGIGENSPAVRSRICKGLEFIGISIDESKNEKNALDISAPEAQRKALVVKTNEELMIARHCLRNCQV